MKARKIVFFVSLVVAVLFFNIGITQAEIVIDNSDIPLGEKCFGEYGWFDAYAAGQTDKWWGWDIAAKWGDPDVTKWAPKFAGLKVSQNRAHTEFNQ